MQLDHLLYVGPDLDELVGGLAHLSGLHATVGGRHPGQGTHNALLGLGKDRYLELMAPDPHQAGVAAHETGPARGGTPPGSTAPGTTRPGTTPPGTFLGSIAYATTPQVFTWCAKARNVDAFAAAARALGLDVTIYGGSRETPAGATLRWDLMIVGGHGLGGQVPFFIDWHDSPHPARTMRADLVLTGLRLLHPDPEALDDLLHALDRAGGLAADEASAVTTVRAAQPALVASLAGPLGPFQLSGRGGRLLTP